MDNLKDLIDYAIKHSDQRFDEMNSRMNSVDKKLEALVFFRYQVIGGAVVLGVLINIVLQIFSAIIQRG